ncbi:MAG: NAD(P)H-dependent oxidoreductase [Bacteroidota bacterium]
MTKRILAFGASNSKHSINKKFAAFAANKLENAEVNLIDMNDYELPLYSVDLQTSNGIHQNAMRFAEKIKQSDAIIISLAEYNGLHTSAFKNLWDWLSRIPSETQWNIWKNKPMLLLSASPSKRPVNNVIKVSKQLFPHFGANIIADFYLPSFHHFFDNNRITKPKYKEEFEIAFKKFQDYLKST